MAVRHGSATEVRGSAIAILGNAELSLAQLRLQGDLLDDLGLGLWLGKAPVNSAACMVAQR